jgi:hypothetical protein
MDKPADVAANDSISSSRHLTHIEKRSWQEMLHSVPKYLLNCFLLMIPVLIWNVLLLKKLPSQFQSEVFWKNIPWAIAYGENFSRTIVMMLPLLMPLSVETVIQKTGLLLYGIGLLLYFTSWTALIFYPTSSWSLSVFGYVAPALTPLIWLIGIGMIGARLYFNVKYQRWYYFAASLFFVTNHCAHAALICLRNARTPGFM